MTNKMISKLGISYKSIIFINLFTISTIFGQLDTAFVRKFNETIAGNDAATAIASDNNGNVYVTGYTGTNDLPDYATIKINPFGETLWVKTYNGSGNGSDRANAIGLDYLGNVYITGESEGIGSSYDYVTVKYNSNGEQEWVQRYNGTANGIDEAIGLKIDNLGNIYVTGSSDGIGSAIDYVTIKYNSNGVEQWAQRFNGIGNGDDQATAIVLDNQDNVYITGESEGASTGIDYATIKYNATGIQQWVAQYDGTGESDDYATAVAVNNQGNVYVTGESDDPDADADYATVKYNSAGVHQWTRRYDGTGNDDDHAYSISVDTAGNVYVTGESFGLDSYYDYATIKYSTTGVLQWVQRYNGTGNGNDLAYSVLLDSQGNVYVTGESYSSSSGIDFASVKYNSAGVQLWVVRYNGPGNNSDYPSSLVIDSSENIYVTGQSEGVNTNYDFLTIKYNANGIEQWVQRYNGLGNSLDEINALKVDEAGNSYITGTSSGSGTKNDYITVKYSGTGVQQWAQRYNGTGNSDDAAYAVAVDNNGNVYVTGESNESNSSYDCTTIKYNSTGIQQWVRKYNSASNLYDWGSAIAVDSLGNIYVAGGSEGTSTDYDYLTIKYNSDGVEQWVQRYNGTTSSIDYATAIALDNIGNIYVTGTGYSSSTSYDYLTIKYNSDGVEQWTGRYNGPANYSDAPNAIFVDNSNNIYVTGKSYGISTGRDYATVKYNSIGVQQWVQRYNGPGNSDDIANAIIVDESGNVYITGASNGSGTDKDYTTIKYDSSGVQEWVQRYNGLGNGDDEAFSIKTDYFGNVYITGESYSLGTDFDYVTIKYNANGLQQWLAIYNGPNNRSDRAVSIDLDNLNHVYVTGTSYDLGTSYDGITIKYNQQSGIEELSIFNCYRLTLDVTPNPFTSYTSINYSVPVDENITFQVFDITGKMVKTLVNNYVPVGKYTIRWDGLDNRGEKVSQGIYYLVLTSTSQKLSYKILLVN